MKVLIIGGGFAGVRAALELAKDAQNEITLVSDKPDFQYYPTLFSTATGRSHLESWAPLGEIFADYDNVDVYIDTIETINTTSNIVEGTSGTVYHYTTLIMAIGVITTYFHIPGLETYAHGIKSEAEIRRLKQQLFIDIAEKGKIDKNYVVIGAGPTGVELAASLGTYIKRLCRHYEVKDRRVKVRLIEAAPRILPRSSPMTSQMALRRLHRLGVTVQTNTKVERETAETLVINGRTIESHTVIWASGVANHPFFAKYPDVFTLDQRGRVVVDEYLQAHPNVYVIGDNAATPYTGQAQTALHDAITVARNLRRLAAGKAPRKYRPRLPVSAIPIGSNWAVIEWRWIRLYGWLGAAIRRAADLIGYLDVLPLGTSIGAWRAATVYEDDYFTPVVKKKDIR